MHFLPRTTPPPPNTHTHTHVRARARMSVMPCFLRLIRGVSFPSVHNQATNHTPPQSPPSFLPVPSPFCVRQIRRALTALVPEAPASEPTLILARLLDLLLLCRDRIPSPPDPRPLLWSKTGKETDGRGEGGAGTHSQQGPGEASKLESTDAHRCIGGIGDPLGLCAPRRGIQPGSKGMATEAARAGGECAGQACVLGLPDMGKGGARRRRMMKWSRRRAEDKEGGGEEQGREEGRGI